LALLFSVPVTTSKPSISSVECRSAHFLLADRVLITYNLSRPSPYTSLLLHYSH